MVPSSLTFHDIWIYDIWTFHDIWKHGLYYFLIYLGNLSKISFLHHEGNWKTPVCQCSCPLSLTATYSFRVHPCPHSFPLSPQNTTQQVGSQKLQKFSEIILNVLSYKLILSYLHLSVPLIFLWSLQHFLPLFCVHTAQWKCMLLINQSKLLVIYKILFSKKTRVFCL